jgi:hypothetical protein
MNCHNYVCEIQVNIGFLKIKTGVYKFKIKIAENNRLRGFFAVFRVGVVATCPYRCIDKENF